jgi:hypothetical protein
MNGTYEYNGQRFQHLACDHCYGQVKRDDECTAEPIKGPRSPTGSCNYHGIPGPWDPQAGTQNQITSIARWHFSTSSPHFFLAVSCVESAPPSYTDCSKIRLDRSSSSIGGDLLQKLHCSLLVTCGFHVAVKTPHNKLCTRT